MSQKREVIEMGSLDLTLNAISKKADGYLIHLGKFDSFVTTGAAKEIRPLGVYLDPEYLKASTSMFTRPCTVVT